MNVKLPTVDDIARAIEQLPTEEVDQRILADQFRHLVQREPLASLIADVYQTAATYPTAQAVVEMVFAAGMHMGLLIRQVQAEPPERVQ